MRKALNYHKGVKGEIVKSARRRKESVRAKNQANIELCTSCPFPSCKKGVCAYFKENKV